MIGRKFGRLTILEDSGKRKLKTGGGPRIIWLCRCDCGNLKEVFTSRLTSGTTRSCGCLRRTHGDAGTLLYKIWFYMKDRCYRKKNHRYKYYGAKGIKVCPSWLNDFPNFKSWALSHGYQAHLTIDRINHKGNYSPRNCQWLTASENSKKAMRDRKLLREIKV